MRGAQRVRPSLGFGAALVVVTGAVGVSPAVARPAEPAPQTRGAPSDEEFSQAELAALCTRLIGTERERAERRLAARPGTWLAAYLGHAAALPAWQRAAFVRAGAQLGERRARRLVRHVWLDEDDPTVLRAAARLAARVHERTVLRELLRSEDAEERALAVRSLGADAEAVPAILERLRRDSDAYVREAAARSLARHVEPQVAEGLLAAAVSDRQPRVRRQAARSLQRCLRRLPTGSLRDEALQLVVAQPLDECVLPLVPDLLAGSGIGRLRPLLDTEDARLRAAVLRALVARARRCSGFEREAIEREIVARLADPDDRVQRVALHAIARLRIESAARSLVERLRNGRDPLSDEVVAALRALSGERFGASYRMWRRWLEAREHTES